MKKTTSILLPLLFVATVFANCTPKEEKDNTPVLALLLYANDQLSGNCAIVTRNSTTSYSASLNSVPKGGCKINSTKAEVEASYNTQKTNVVAFFTKAGSSCDAVTTAFNNSVNTLITNTNNTDDATFAASVEKQRAFSIGNLVTESTNTLKAAGRTDAQIAATSPASLDEMFFVTAISTAGNAGVAACVTALKALNQAAADALTSTPPTKVALSSCTYGSAQPATSKCATLNSEF
ncbi:hypothetical protein EHQ16_01200 [Leptospira kanakyensis]|uniref:Lipoprotein LipL36 n=1 Tax=Leptospira kanakyensis TaxID=2484968 RepID=A0A6N4PZF3_9LEPT|nr:hypothetical protein [Leptospira kanakyensis]TGK47879.1 hypothetical protein EHQ11_18385 [Leptospira kanakyensis]TGK63113.1 hypothetical protein EHQ16_01200 [Leptospira kanakyensis]TGK66719.1 hypothetical protein EHQ18_16435 [Leptospira kanakyensis]